VQAKADLDGLKQALKKAKHDVDSLAKENGALTENLKASDANKERLAKENDDRLAKVTMNPPPLTMNPPPLTMILVMSLANGITRLGCWICTAWTTISSVERVDQQADDHLVRRKG
jgi:hypothetical protein